MKRTDFYIKLTTAVLFIAVLSYIGVYIYNALTVTYETIPAIRYSIEQTFSTHGYIIRTETVLSEVGNTALPIIPEGEKAASGQVIAVEYLNNFALETASEIRELRFLIAGLESSEGEDAVELARKSSINDLSKAIQLGDLSRLDELALNVETNVFSSITANQTNLNELKARLAKLETDVYGVRMIYAPVSGIFSQYSDGYEHITPNMIQDITPDLLDALFSDPQNTTQTGKLITEFKWYYAAIMDANEAELLPEGKTVTLQMTGVYSSSVVMTIERIFKQEADSRVVLFSSNRSIHEMVSVRRVGADLIYNIITGIRVPKEAIHLDDDNVTFIYLQTGIRAERVDVEILAEIGGSYIVRDGAQAGTPLRPGSEIIVKANEIFDGKTVGLDR